MNDTLRNDPQCLSGSLQKPGCAAERFKAKIVELERALTKYEGAKLPESRAHDDLCERIEVDIGVGNMTSPCGCYERELLAYAAAQTVRANDARAKAIEECATIYSDVFMTPARKEYASAIRALQADGKP